MSRWGAVTRASFAMLLAGCPDRFDVDPPSASTSGVDGVPDDDSAGDDEMSADGELESASADDAVSTDPGSEDGAESTTGSECPAASECQTAADCDFGVQCVDCMCEVGEETGSSDDDPYPPPMNGMCPAGYGSIDPAQAGGGVCAPPCEAMFTCPEPTSGTAMGACALVEPGGTMTECEMAGMPCEGEEICLMFAEGLQCSNPPMWCFLSCMGGEMCPDGQMCGPAGICAWPE